LSKQKTVFIERGEGRSFSSNSGFRSDDAGGLKKTLHFYGEGSLECLMTKPTLLSEAWTYLYF
jgi:hypothetical protein